MPSLNTKQRNDTALDRSLDNDTRRILSEAMGTEFHPLEVTELKLRREALEMERKSRYKIDLSDIPVAMPGEDSGTGSLPSSPQPVAAGGDAKNTQVFQVGC